MDHDIRLPSDANLEPVVNYTHENYTNAKKWKGVEGKVTSAKIASLSVDRI